jgi:hypothetical protein
MAHRRHASPGSWPTVPDERGSDAATWAGGVSPPGRDPAGDGPRPHVRPCRVHGRKSRCCCQLARRRDVGDVAARPRSGRRRPRPPAAGPPHDRRRVGSRLAAIRQVMAPSPSTRPWRPVNHTIAADLLGCERQPPGRDRAGDAAIAAHAAPGSQTERSGVATWARPHCRLAAIGRGCPSPPAWPPVSPVSRSPAEVKPLVEWTASYGDPRASGTSSVRSHFFNFRSLANLNSAS